VSKPKPEFKHPIIAAINDLVGEHVVESGNPMITMLWKIVGADFPSMLRSLDDNEELCEKLIQRFREVTEPPIDSHAEELDPC